MNVRFFFILLLATSLFAKKKPRAVIVISFDQMRGDYFKRWEKYFSEKGFKRVFEQGTYFSACYYEHANNMTGPGHATLLTGKYPNLSGIVANNFYDYSYAHKFYCVEDPVVPSEISPKLLATETLQDVLKKHNPRSKVISVALKDRAAVLMAGKSSEHLVFWFDSRNKKFTSSKYYEKFYEAESLSADFSTLFPVARYSLETWKASLQNSPYPDSSEYEGNFPAGGNNVFPHRLPPINSTKFSKAFLTSPFSVEYLFEFSKFLIIRNKIGKDKHTDIITIGVSSTDYVGHRFGPDSREILEMYVAVDKMLADFLDFLDKEIKDYVLVITSDHGVTPIPETVNAGRFSEKELQREINQYLGKNAVKHITGNMIYLNEEFRTPEIREKIKSFLLSINGIKQVFSKAEILSCSDSEECLLIKNDFFSSRFGDLYILMEENYIFGKYPASHGSLYRLDRFVPLVFYGQKIPSREIMEQVTPADIAPTLADILGVPLQAPYGNSLKEYFR